MNHHLLSFKIPTIVSQDGWSPLITSSLNGHLDVVKALNKAGANINQADEVSTHICSTHICSIIVIHSYKMYMCALYDYESPDIRACALKNCMFI